MRKVESDTTTKTESAATKKARIARAALPRPESRPLTRDFFQTLLATLEADRHNLPVDPKEFNVKARELYEELRLGINKATPGMRGNAEWSRAIDALIDDSKRRRAGDAAMQLHGDRRQARQKQTWETTLEQAFALLRRATV